MKNLRVVCCVCGKIIKDGDPLRPVSHSYCDECSDHLSDEAIDKLALEINTKRKEKR
jgi:hypothetical protein